MDPATPLQNTIISHCCQKVAAWCCSFLKAHVTVKLMFFNSNSTTTKAGGLLRNSVQDQATTKTVPTQNDDVCLLKVDKMILKLLLLVFISVSQIILV